MKTRYTVRVALNIETERVTGPDDVAGGVELVLRQALGFIESHFHSTPANVQLRIDSLHFIVEKSDFVGPDPRR